MSKVINGTDEEVDAMSCQDLEDDFIVFIKGTATFDEDTELLLRETFKSGVTVGASKASDKSPDVLTDLMKYMMD